MCGEHCFCLLTNIIIFSFCKKLPARVRWDGAPSRPVTPRIVGLTQKFLFPGIGHRYTTGTSRRSMPCMHACMHPPIHGWITQFEEHSYCRAPILQGANSNYPHIEAIKYVDRKYRKSTKLYILDNSSTYDIAWFARSRRLMWNELTFDVGTRCLPE